MPKVVSTGRAILLESKFAGDEPFMLAANLDGVSVVVDKDRVKGGRFAISELKADTLLLDGIPRNPRQAEIMRDLIDVKAIFNLFCPVLDKLVVRLQRRALKENRLDDANIETIRSRLETYKKETRAVLECYPDTLIHQIDSTQEPMFVLLDILKVIAQIPKPAVSDGGTVYLPTTTPR
jgi:adenylate kinase family enzyme